MAAALSAVEGVHGAVAPAAPDWRRGGTALVEAIPVPDSGDRAGKDTLDAVRRAAHAVPDPASASAASRRPTPTSSTPSTAASR